MRVFRNARLLFLPLTVSLLTLALGCAPAEEAAEESTTSADTEAVAVEAPADTSPRVFFVGLEDGATVPPLLSVEFGAENFVIEPVGEGMVHEGKGHFHIGIDTDCLEPGTVIPTADPWIHFGDGSNSIDLSLEPGPHTLVLQVGDGEHRTLADPGLCAVIHVNVEESEADA